MTSPLFSESIRMPSAFSRPVSRTLGFALTGICAVTLMTGCGGSDDGSPAAAAGPTNAAVYDGSGQEALGSYVGRVSAATGLYATDHYAPVGLTQRMRLALSGTNLVLTTYYLSTGTILAANATSKTYEGTNVWAPSDGSLAGIAISEHWTLSFADGGVVITVAATAGAKTGTLALELNPSTYSYDNTHPFLFGTTTADQADSRYEGCTSVLHITDVNPGAVAVWTPTDSASSHFYFDGFLQDGDTLTAGGFGSGLAMSHTDRFAIMTMHVNRFGQPESASVVISDNNARDDDGLIDVEPAEYTIKAAGFRSISDYLQLYQHTNTFQTLHVESITPGGVLYAQFGAAGLDIPGGFQDAGYYVQLIGPSFLFNAGYVSPTHRHAVRWEGRYNDFYNDDAFTDIDSLLTTQERVTMDVEYNAAHFAIGGTVKVEVYDMADVLLKTETMTYTVRP